MAKLKFLPSDFSTGVHHHPTLGSFKAGLVPNGLAAQMAQAKFDKWLSEQRVVHGQLPVEQFNWTGPKQWHDTHKALLVCIEPIACQHVPANKIDFDTKNCSYVANFSETVCAKCGAKLKATWRAE